jgi:subtilase family protein
MLVAAALVDPSVVAQRSSPPAPGRSARVGASSMVLRTGAADASKRGRHSVRGRPDLARVEIFHVLEEATARSRVQHFGGRVTGEVPGVLVQAQVPWDRIASLEKSPGISSIRPEQSISQIPGPDGHRAGGNETRRRHRKKKTLPVFGEEITKLNADDWQASGKFGAGVKVGIIDIFSRTAYEAAQRAGQVPAPSGTFCLLSGLACNAFTVTPGAEHGTAVAEIVHEMAPDAELYLAFVNTTSDMQAAVDYFLANGVRIVTRSLTSAYDGAGDGTGPVATVINNAIHGGITWFNSAGNAAAPAGQTGAYYRGTFTDTDGDGFHEFAPGFEVLGLPCFTFTHGLRWDDFDEVGTDVTDFDLIEVDANNNVLDVSVDFQGSTGGFAPPLENFDGGTSCTNKFGTGLVFVAIQMVAPGSDPNDVLEFQNNGRSMTFSSNPYSAAVPACDVATKGLLCVGAIDPAFGSSIAPYSSQGPTNDERIKPDLVAAACVRTFTFRRCFNGTSSSAPAAAGAAALVLGAGIASTTPADLDAFLRTSAFDLGAAGPDNVYGNGELTLPAPPPT